VRTEKTLNLGKMTMNEKTWYLHVDGEAVGPMSTNALTKMIRQNRCNAADYVSNQGGEWTRLGDCGEFGSCWPTTPKIAAPATSAAKAKLIEMPDEGTSDFARPEPKAKVAPAPKKPVAVAAPAPEPVAPPKPAPKPAPAPKPLQPIDAVAKVNGTKHKVAQLTETAVLFEDASLEVGTDVKVRLESPAFPKGLELTGIVATENKIAFTRMNPAHRRSISQYLVDHGTEQEKDAA
jgi:hypothetical protein